ncbi:LysR family transcriptional regulator [Phaeacidiphilus oryzae]|uniref:LysR family transcriptional regulator n=1 Tax=Phaeacidiphilus oryzae TaxID=348818 RepID=UPI000569C457|nr:LysR family transcriptional regulator [Phaeacidiphilus oryzae]
MELRHLQAFVAVAEELSFSRAAARLHMTQPPLSQQIKRLEREVGAQLLHRTTRSVELTAAGEAFLREVRVGLEAIAGAQEAARRAAAGQSGRVRLGFSGPTSYRELLFITREFRDARPSVRLEVVGPLYAGELAERLLRLEIDAGLLRLPLPEELVRAGGDGGGLRVRELIRHSLVAAVPQDHPLAAQSALRFIDLDGVPLVNYPSGRGSTIRGMLATWFRERGMRLVEAQEAPDTHTILSMAAAGAGVGLVPVSAAHLTVPGLRFLPIVDAPPVPLGLAWRADDPNPALDALITVAEGVRERLGDLADLPGA